MSKFYLPILIVVLAIVAGFVLYSVEKPKIAENEASLIINYEETKRAFAGEVIDNMTILDAVRTSAKAGNFDFDYQEDVLKRIDEIEQNEKKWNAYLNGTEIQESLDKVLIKAGDKIELKLE